MSDETDRGYVFGLEVDGLGDHITPLETVTLIKALDEDGDPALFLRAARRLTEPTGQPPEPETDAPAPAHARSRPWAKR